MTAIGIFSSSFCNADYGAREGHRLDMEAMGPEIVLHRHSLVLMQGRLLTQAHGTIQRPRQ